MDHAHGGDRYVATQYIWDQIVSPARRRRSAARYPGPVGRTSEARS
jgi:hypothetical protein